MNHVHKSLPRTKDSDLIFDIVKHESNRIVDRLDVISHDSGSAGMHTRELSLKGTSRGVAKSRVEEGLPVARESRIRFLKKGRQVYRHNDC